MFTVESNRKVLEFNKSGINFSLDFYSSLTSLELLFPGIKNIFRSKTIRYLKRLQIGEYNLLDPLISDWSCQLRALYFWKMANDTSSFTDLSELDALFIGAALFLTETSSQQLDNLGMSFQHKTNESLFPRELLAHNSKKNRQLLFGLCKQFIALKTLTELFMWAESQALSLRSQINAYFQNIVIFKYGEIKIPFLKFYSGYLILLSFAKKNKIPITLHLTQFICGIETINPKINGKTKLLYVYDDALDVFIYQSSAAPWEGKPTILF